MPALHEVRFKCPKCGDLCQNRKLETVRTGSGEFLYCRIKGQCSKRGCAHVVPSTLQSGFLEYWQEQIQLARYTVRVDYRQATGTVTEYNGTGVIDPYVQVFWGCSAPLKFITPKLRQMCWEFGSPKYDSRRQAARNKKLCS